MIPQYRPNEMDRVILHDLTGYIEDSVEGWYGSGATLDVDTPEIRSYRNSFILRYPVTTSPARRKTILVKIRRNPKMDSLRQAVEADIHQNIPMEYRSLTFVHDRLSNKHEDFAAIRSLAYIEKYYAIVMEEYPSRTLRQLLVEQRSSKEARTMEQVKDAARKTGRWLYYFHQHIHTPYERPYSTGDILQEVQEYAEQLEANSRGRVRARSIQEAFARHLEPIQIDRMRFSQSHADMTCDNVLYSEDQKVCVIDIKTRPASVYADLGLILVHPETSKPQIFSAGTYFPETLLREYRAEIMTGYFEQEPADRTVAGIYGAVMVLNKWLMYEELMNRYRGVKQVLALPVGPFVSAYFQNLMKKHLALIGNTQPRQNFKMKKTADGSA